MREYMKTYRQVEDRRAQRKQLKHEEKLRRLQEREQQDLPRLRRAAEICRLVESLRTVIAQDGAPPDSLRAAEDLSEEAISKFSQLVCAGLDERFTVVEDELKAHRSLATSTTGVASQVEASDDDPYLKALSNVLQFADNMIEKLLLGEYAVAASADQPSAGSAGAGPQGAPADAATVAVNKLATNRIVRDVEKKTTATALFVLDAFFEDKKIDEWLQRVERFRSDRREMRRADVDKLDELLHDVMFALTYCGHFTNFLRQLGVIDPSKIASSGITAKQLDLASAYIQLEQMWMTCSLLKARAFAACDSDGSERVNSIVGDTLFVVRKAFARAIHTENDLACSATANHIYQLLKEHYSEDVLTLLQGRSIRLAEDLELAELIAGIEVDDREDRGGAAGAGGAAQSPAESEGAEDWFAAALESDLQGLGTLSSALLVAVNTAELSANYMSDFVYEVRYQFENRFPNQAAGVEMALQELQATAELHERVRLRAIQDIVSGCLKPSLELKVGEYMQGVTYNVSHAMFEMYEREDPFVSKFIRDQLVSSRNFSKCQRNLTKSNYCVLLAAVAKVVAAAWEAELLRSQTFNELGGLRLDQDVREMVRCICDCYLTPEEKAEREAAGAPMDDEGDEQEVADRDSLRQQVRDHFARLTQVAFLVGLERTSHVERVPYSLPPALTAAEARAVLRLRVPAEAGVDIAALDVSGVAAASP